MDQLDSVALEQLITQECKLLADEVVTLHEFCLFYFKQRDKQLPSLEAFLTVLELEMVDRAKIATQGLDNAIGMYSKHLVPEDYTLLKGLRENTDAILAKCEAAVEARKLGGSS